MAILGSGGFLTLRREPPKASVVSPAALHQKSNSIVLENQDFWSGDAVFLSSNAGLPMGHCPNGQGNYAGSNWLLGPNRAHIANDASLFYTVDTNIFYDSSAADNAGTFFIHRDQLDRISFYSDSFSAINGEVGDRIPLSRVDWGNLIIAPSGTSDYDNAIVKCAGDIGAYRFSDITDEITLISICDDAPQYLIPEAGTEPYDNADILPRGWIAGRQWLTQCDLKDWSLELQALNVETTALGQRFGESVKSIVTGGGSLNFFVERRISKNPAIDGLASSDSTNLLQLLLLTEKGCKAEAQFWMIEDRDTSGNCQNLAAGDLFYECEILITQSAVNCRPTELIAGSCQFATTGTIALKIGR